MPSSNSARQHFSFPKIHMSTERGLITLQFKPIDPSAVGCIMSYIPVVQFQLLVYMD